MYRAIGLSELGLFCVIEKAMVRCFKAFEQGSAVVQPGEDGNSDASAEKWKPPSTQKKKKFLGGSE